MRDSSPVPEKSRKTPCWLSGRHRYVKCYGLVSLNFRVSSNQSETINRSLRHLYEKIKHVKKRFWFFFQASALIVFSICFSSWVSWCWKLKNYRVAWNFCGTFILRICDFLRFAGTNFCASNWPKFPVGTNVCGFQAAVSFGLCRAPTAFSECKYKNKPVFLHQCMMYSNTNGLKAIFDYIN